MNSRFTYTGIRVRDMDRAIRFYTEGLGMELLGRRKIPRTGGENVDLKSPGSDHVIELNSYPTRGC
jgi:lactoylglutathione lyase